MRKLTDDDDDEEEAPLEKEEEDEGAAEDEEDECKLFEEDEWATRSDLCLWDSVVRPWWFPEPVPC